jgi:DNA topoisomerase-1
VQLGDPIEGEKKKPKMASLLPGMSESTLTLEEAVKLLTLTRNLGKHPETGHVVVVSNGRFGPYVKCHEETRSVPLAELSPLDMTFEDALRLLSQPKARGRQAAVAKSLRDLGPHPASGKELSIKAGRYGPYVSDGEVNASLPKGRAPETLSVEEAVELLSARAAKIAEEGGLPAKKKRSAGKKAAPKKSAKKKAAATEAVEEVEA